MNRDYIEKNDVVDRYVLGHLSDEELGAFEQYYFEHPEILDEIELVRSMKRGIEENQALVQRSTRETDIDHPKGTTSLFDSLFGRIAIPVAAFALGALTVGPLFFDQGGVNSGSAMVTSSVVLTQYRGGTRPVPTITNSGKGVLLIGIDMSGISEMSLSAQIRKADGEDIILSMPIAPDADDYAQIIVPSSTLSSGSFHLDLLGLGAVVRTYSFSVSGGPNHESR